MESIQRREERWAIVDLVGKGRHIRTVPVPVWVKDTLDAWLAAARVENGPLFRCVCRADKLWGQGISEKTIWHVVKKAAAGLKILSYLHTTSAVPARDFATPPVENSNRSSFSSVMFRCRLRNATSAANNG